MSGTRRARALVAGISSSLAQALALADRLDEQADQIEVGARPGMPGSATPGLHGTDEPNGPYGPYGSGAGPEGRKRRDHASAAPPQATGFAPEGLGSHDLGSHDLGSLWEVATRAGTGAGTAGPGAHRLPSEVGKAAAIAEVHAAGFAGMPWSSPDWLTVGTAGHPPGHPPPHAGAPGSAPFRPGLWRIGTVGVPALWPGGEAGGIPLAVPFLDAGNLAIDVDRDRRADAIGVVRGLLTRLLAAVPPGTVRLTVYDPHELGAGLAGFAPLRAVGVAEPTLTTRTRLEAALAQLAADVGRITVDRLGGRYACLREREDAGLPRSEPWRVLVLLSWPALSDDGVRALEAVAGQGPACGVHVVAVHERDRAGQPPGAGGRRVMQELPNAERLVVMAGPAASAGGNGRRRGNGSGSGSGGDSGGRGRGSGGRGSAVVVPPAPAGEPMVTWQCSLSGALPCWLDDPPPSGVVAGVTATVAAGAAAEAARPPDVRSLLPPTLWGHDSAGGLSVAVARGPDGPVELTFDDDTVHGLVGGQAGSGKSTLLLDVVYGLAARYGPDQLRFHLLDFKEGLEFAQFAPRPGGPFFLPHADTVGMDSDREFGVAVLRHVREQMQRRAVAMRAAGARDLRGLRAADHGSSWPRVMVVVDEFQVMLTPLDSVSREAVAHLEVLARQGRAYGIHLLLASQTLSGIDALDATAGKRGSIFGQFALRVALRTSISESRVLLSTANEAAGGLDAVGQAIINRRNGHPGANEEVRVAYPDAATLASLRSSIFSALMASTPSAPAPRVFVGHAPALLDDNPAYRRLSGRPAPGADGGGTGAQAYGGGQAHSGADGDGGADAAPLAFVGVPLDLSPPAAGVRLSPLPGRNLAVLGPLRREAVGALEAAVASLALQAVPGGVYADLVAVGPATEEAAQVCAARLAAAGQVAVVHGVSGLRRALHEAVAEVRAREDAALRPAGYSIAGHASAPGRAPAAVPPPVPLRLMVLFAADAGRAGLEPRDPVTGRTGLDDLRQLARRGPAQRVHLLGWWRGPSRLLDDLGAAHRDDVGAWLSVGVPGGDLYSLAGHRSVPGGTMPNRGVLFDRHGQAEPRTIIPFAPLTRLEREARVPGHRAGRG